jgi:protein phosphatase
MSEARAAHAHPTLAFQAAGVTDIGRVRPHNEDAILVRPDLRLWAVADGAGGHNAGNVASALGLASLANHFEATEPTYRDRPDVDGFGVPVSARRLSGAVRKANDDIVEISKSSKKYGGMGSTMVACALARRSPVLHVAHVGDSRCYRLRSGCLEQLTHDHSLRNDVIEMHPDLPDAAFAKLPRHVVTRALGMEATVRAAVRPYGVMPGDVYLLCSDGLTGEVDDERIRQVLASDEAPNTKCDRLVALANDAGGRDNIAVVVIAFESAEPGDEPEAAAIPELAPALEPEQPELRSEMASSPEILLLGIESDVDPEEAIRVVPSESKTSGLYRALGGLLLPTKRPRPAQAFCTACGAALSSVAIAAGARCPMCGGPIS